MKNGDVIDLTIKRKGSKPYGRIIDICPVCGKKAEVSTYKDGSINYTHIKIFNGWYFDIKESCYISNKIFKFIRGNKLH